MQADGSIRKNQLGATLARGRVGIAVNSFESAYYSRVMESASNYLKARDFSTIFQTKKPSVDAEREAFTTLVDGDCDAYIFQADFLPSDELNQLMQGHPNLVMVNRHLSLFPERCVDVDNFAGGEIAARFLTAQGHRNIGMVRGPDDFGITSERALGFKRVLEKLNLKLIVDLVGNFVEAGGEHAMQTIHAEHPDVTAIFFHNDDMAFGALNACRQLGVKVPEEMSIVGFDGIPMCEYVTPRLTSVQQPLRQIGELAAQVCIDLLLNVKESKRTVGATYVPVLGERESVSPLVGGSPEKIFLTQRETECLTWTANGKTSWEISVILGISESTATFHLRNAAIKLKASNRTHAAVKALHMGLIDFQPG